MRLIKEHKRVAIAVICVVTVLCVAAFFGDNHNAGNDAVITNDEGYTEVLPPERDIQAEEEESVASVEPTEQLTEPKKNAPRSDSGIALSEKEENSESEEERLVCTLSVNCRNAVGKESGKESILRPDGVIFAEQEVDFFENESVFDVLLREMKKNKIHLEFVNTPIYNSAYIEGIGNLYEFDLGELSGWMYKVNGQFPNYGCSEYKLKKGDRIEWVYTCDLGKDVGGENLARNGMENE